MARTLSLGHAQHFIGASHCQFHLGTLVEGPGGRYVVSTVGDYYPPSSPNPRAPTRIGWNRLFETYVFECDAADKECGCPNIASHTELDSMPANDATTAQANHAKMVAAWAERVGEADVPRLVGGQR